MTYRLEKTYITSNAQAAIGEALHDFDNMFRRVLPSRITAEYSDAGWFVVIEA